MLMTMFGRKISNRRIGSGLAAFGLLVGLLMAPTGSWFAEEAKKGEEAQKKAEPAQAKPWKSEAGTYAVFDTTEGKIVCQLFEKLAPVTVQNFISLAEGTKEFTDPVAGVKATRPYYDGTKFHRIISSFMMQGGDPTGTGRGGPGYTIPDEFSPEVKFDRPGRLAMANAGPNTGGSQFFITQVVTAWLTGKHTIFGQVVEGQEIVDRVCKEIGSQSGKSSKDVVIKKLTIVRVDAKAGK